MSDGSADRQPRRRLPRSALIMVAVVALVAALIAGFIILLQPGNVAADEIRTEPGRTPGVNPFMPPAGDDQPDVTPPPGTGGSFDGNTSGLYGGTLNNSACDPQTMIKFLQAHPDKGAAWAGVQNISPADLSAYISGLTPVLLRSDTAVTNHGYANDRATTLHSVLEAGTAVLVDEYGVPRARCYCGNPLTPANPPTTKRYVGPTWSGFSPASITISQAAATPITEFTLVNPFTYEIFYRPVGTTGQQDRPLVPPPAPSTPETPPPAPAEPPEPPQPRQPPAPPVQPRVQPPQPEFQQPSCPRDHEWERGRCRPIQQKPKHTPEKECNYDDGTSKGCGSDRPQQRDPDRPKHRDPDRQRYQHEPERPRYQRETDR